MFDPDQAKAMAKAGADQLVAHVGLTTAGLDRRGRGLHARPGDRQGHGDRRGRPEVRKDIIVICHGGPFDEPDQVGKALLRMPGVHGFFGASSIERLPTERAIRGQVEEFKKLAVA